MATKKTTTKKIVEFILTDVGYLLKGKSIKETNEYCLKHKIDYKTLKEHTIGEKATIEIK